MAAKCFWALCLAFLCVQPLSAQDSSVPTYSLDDIILDIYNACMELGEVDFEQMQTDLYALHAHPINLNNTSDEELSQLYFLSPQQIDAILLHAGRQPFASLYELRMIDCFKDYEIRNLLPFVYVGASAQDARDKMYAREVFAHASHELITRIDARNIESFDGTDPMFVQTRYRFDYQRRVLFGAQLRRPAGQGASALQYGAYLQLRDIGHLHTLVAGNFQASFGQGLVFAQAFHAGKSMYVTSAGQQRNGLRYYSSVDGEGLHGAGATLRWQLSPHTRLDASALYSLQRANDSLWHHVIGANITLRHRRMEWQLTAAQSIWSDSIRPYRNTAYNTHYFRGTHQTVLGTSFRYNHGVFDLFGELATAQNAEAPTAQQPTPTPHWGIGALVGSRFYPTQGLSLIALYRYYSPYFDNALGYAFSETKRIGDENGGYVGIELTRWRNWHLSAYADVFYFSGPKYNLPTYPTLGYDALFEARYTNQRSKITNHQSSITNHQSKITNHQSPITNHQSSLQEGQGLGFSFRLRARQKGISTYSSRVQFDYQLPNWSFRTTADANIVPTNQQSSINNQQSSITYGFSLAQDLAYTPSFKLSRPTFELTNPLQFKFRLQFFDAREWVNRIYLYEHDVLYAFSIPATYGLGGRAYLCVRWQIMPQLALYFRLSETLYARDWYISKHPDYTSSHLPTRTDIHLLLRAKL